MMPSEPLPPDAVIAAGIEERLEAAEPYICSRAARVRLPSHDRDDVRQELRAVAIDAAATYQPESGVPWTAYVCRRLALRSVDLMRARGRLNRDGKQIRPVHVSLDASDEDQRLDMWEPVDEGDDASDVDWQDLVEVVSRESLQVRAIVLRAGGLSQQQIADIAGVTESRICQVLRTTDRNYSDALDRIRYLIGRAGEPVRSDRWRRAQPSANDDSPAATPAATPMSRVA